MFVQWKSNAENEPTYKWRKMYCQPASCFSLYFNFFVYTLAPNEYTNRPPSAATPLSIDAEQVLTISNWIDGDVDVQWWRQVNCVKMSANASFESFTVIQHNGPSVVHGLRIIELGASSMYEWTTQAISTVYCTVTMGSLEYRWHIRFPALI